MDEANKHNDENNENELKLIIMVMCVNINYYKITKTLTKIKWKT